MMEENNFINFEKQIVTALESGNEKDYYYYILEVCDGITLFSSDSTEIVNNNWYIKCFEIPSIKIESVEKLTEFLELINGITKCTYV